MSPFSWQRQNLFLLSLSIIIKVLVRHFTKYIFIMDLNSVLELRLHSENPCQLEINCLTSCRFALLSRRAHFVHWPPPAFLKVVYLVNGRQGTVGPFQISCHRKYSAGHTCPTIPDNPLFCPDNLKREKLCCLWTAITIGESIFLHRLYACAVNL